MARNVAVGAPASPPSPGEAFRADRAKYYRIAYGTEDPPLGQRARLWLGHFGFHCVAVHRLGELCRSLEGRRPVVRLPCALLFRALDLAVQLVHHVAIEAQVGPGFYIGHPSALYIGRTTIGRNFSVTHNVTIGIGHGAAAAGLPVIGDDVWVGTGSVLFGAIRVGDGATISSGTILSRSVPAGALVGGNPGRVLQSGYDNRALFSATPEAGPPEARQNA
ncbi:MAG TPA: hypothetical protein VMB50_24520 [Myxococcales bacterium]|nr:hypothetical protein [Myxococcales bacterium]